MSAAIVPEKRSQVKSCVISSSSLCDASLCPRHSFFNVEKLINSCFLPFYFFPALLPCSLNVSAAISPRRRSTPEHSNGTEGSQEEPEQFGLIAPPLLNIAKRPP